MKLFLLLFFLPLFALSQSIELQSNALFGSSSNLPFWMTHNQLGKYSTTGNFQELTEGQLSGSLPLGKLSLSYGTDLALLISEKNTDAKIIQAYLGLSGKVIRLQAGAFADPELMGGLSSSNGDMLRSLNYRPYPKVRLSTPGFIPFLFAKSWFRFSAEYDEGLLIDDRMVDRPHLHHKSLMLRILARPTTRFTVGINHYAFWGGSSEQYGQLPVGLKSYTRYVTGSAGSDNFVENDRLNAAGNHLGSYLLSIEKDFAEFRLELRATHPFEDGSGRELRNFRDNLYTLHWKKNTPGTLLDELVFEYLYSKHQSGDPNLERGGVLVNRICGADNYFNNSVYQTGFTYFGQIMGIPLFESLQVNEEGKVTGITNNRVSAFHLGTKGYLSKTISWQTMVTYSRNFGTYSAPFQPMRPQFYSLAQLGWQSRKSPLSLAALVGMDLGKLTSDQVGVGCQVQWRF